MSSNILLFSFHYYINFMSIHFVPPSSYIFRLHLNCVCVSLFWLVTFSFNSLSHPYVSSSPFLFYCFFFSLSLFLFSFFSSFSSFSFWDEFFWWFVHKSQHNEHQTHSRVIDIYVCWMWICFKCLLHFSSTMWKRIRREGDWVCCLEKENEELGSDLNEGEDMGGCWFVL